MQPTPEITQNPQNPYISAMVSASAGSGKTYQLSRRFLALVAAGAEPSSILAVTFSKKAAAEMRERIVQDAIALGTEDRAFHDFFRDLMVWHQEGVTKGLPLPPLRSPAEVSNLITRASQSLSITTIDAILMEWCLRFPWETRISDGQAVLMQPWDIATREEVQNHTREAWKNAVTRILSSQTDPEARANLLEQLLLASPGEQLTVAWQRMSPLRQSETFIWLCEHLRGTAALPYPTQDEALPPSSEALIIELSSDLGALINRIPNEQRRFQALAALAKNSMEELIDAGVFTKNYQLNKTTISKGIRSELGAVVDHVDETIACFMDQRRLKDLNLHSALLWQLYHAWSQEHLAVKAKAGRGSFSDALKGVWQLFNERNPGAKWMIQNRVKHLLLDEFQDTSRLQWSAFSELAKEVLGGKSTERDVLPGTVFIVGDAKQSIYGFREAAPEIMDLAVRDLQPHGFEHLEMSSSWRTAPIILDVVNRVFADTKLMDRFPTHHTAQLAHNRLAVPDMGSVTILPVPQNGDGKDDRVSAAKIHVQQEAAQVAAHIGRCLMGEIPCPIWDKKKKEFRSAEPRDFAILYHAKTDADTYEDALRKMHIPSMREERKGFYDRQEIRDTTAFLKWLAWPQDALSLCAVLRSPVGGVPDVELQRILAKSQDESGRLQTESMLAQLKMLRPALATLLQTAARKTQQMPYLSILIWWFRATDILSAYRQAFGALEGELASANLIKMLDTIRSCENLGLGHLQSVVEQLEIWSKDDETGNAATDANAVHLMTLHKSKGLEFPVVILVGLAHDWFKTDLYWLRSTENGTEGLSYVGTATEQPLRDRDFEERSAKHEAAVRREKARLLYVGLTRAQFHLVVSSGFKASKTKPIPPEDCYYMRVQNAVIAAGGENTSIGIRLERISDQCLEQTSEQSSLCEAATAKDFEFFRLREHGNHARVIPPALSILTATAAANRAKESLAGLPLVTLAASPTLVTSHPLLYGQCVHRILELSPLENHHPLTNEVALVRWMRTQLADARRVPRTDLLDIAHRASLAAEACRKSDAWKLIFTSAVKIYREASLAMISPSSSGVDNLTVGQPDLVIERDDQSIWVIDYKTGSVDATGTDSEAAALEYCRQNGYDVQVQTYAQALSKLYPIHQIKPWIFLTQSSILIAI